MGEKKRKGREERAEPSRNSSGKEIGYDCVRDEIKFWRRTGERKANRISIDSGLFGKATSILMNKLNECPLLDAPFRTLPSAIVLARFNHLHLETQQRFCDARSQ